MEIYKTLEKNITSPQEVAEIRLIGEPYQRTVDGHRIDATDVLERLAVSEDYKEELKNAIERNKEYLMPLYEAGYYGIDGKIKKGEQLTFEEAFSLMAFVSMASNRLIRSELAPKVKIGDTSKETVTLQGVALLSAMSTKEAYVGLSAEEIAGLVAATLELDTITRVSSVDQAFAIGGMGGDRGYPKNGNKSKLFSLSTMGSAILANFQNVHKHHSYPNTSKVAGQTAIESIGGRSDQDSLEELEILQNGSGLLMSSCHTTRTIHTISHRLKGETINHVVGPLAIPVSRDTKVNAMIGVNDNVHPETIIKALKILQQKDIQQYGNSVAFCGLLSNDTQIQDFKESNYYKSNESKKQVALDEVAPPPFDTLAAFMVDGQNKGTFIIKSTDFLEEKFLKQVNFEQLLIPNTAESILKANMDSITGSDLAKAIYLSMTVALGVFIKDYAHLPGALNESTRRVNSSMLREAFTRSLEMISNGSGINKLNQYIKMSNDVLN